MRSVNTMNRVAAIILGVTMVQGGEIKVCVVGNENNQAVPLPDALVTCFDEDNFALDEVMIGPVPTDTDGCVLQEYEEKNWDSTPFFRDPEIICTVEKEGMIDVVTLAVEIDSQCCLTDFGTLNMYPDRVARGDPGEPDCMGDVEQWGFSPFTKYLNTLQKATENHDLCYLGGIQTPESCDDEFRDIGKSQCSKFMGVFKGQCQDDVDVMYDIARRDGNPIVNGTSPCFGDDDDEVICSRNLFSRCK